MEKYLIENNALPVFISITHGCLLCEECELYTANPGLSRIGSDVPAMYIPRLSGKRGSLVVSLLSSIGASSSWRSAEQVS